MLDNKVQFIINVTGNANDVINKISQTVQQSTVHVNRFTQNIQKIRDVGLAFQSINAAIGSVTGALANCQELYNIQSQSEKKLETVMRQRTGASDEQINSIKQLAAQQQKLGIIGDEVQLSGAQQLATFIKQKSSIDTLLPAMNNLLAQQSGINATENDAVNIGNLMGKVMQGQTAALTRVGITFTEAQEKVLKYGTEQQRAAMLAQVITDNVGNMNEALAGTPEGKLKQFSNTVGDMRERIGALWVHIQSELLPIVEKVMNKVQSFLVWLEEHKTAITALAIGIATVVTMIKGWVIVQGILNTVMSLNPIGMIVIAIAALVTAIIYVCSKITGWGNLWKGVVGFMKYTFYAYVDSVKLYFATLVNGIMIGLDKIKLGWYKFKEACGIGNSKENQAAIAQINADVEKRQKAIVDGAKSVKENLLKAEESLTGGIKGLSWKSDKEKKENPLGINDNLINAVNGGSGETGSGKTTEAGKSTEAIATGGTRNTEVHITIGDMIRQVTFNGTTAENKQEIERNFAECLYRVLGMAQVSV